MQVCHEINLVELRYMICVRKDFSIICFNHVCWCHWLCVLRHHLSKSATKFMVGFVNSTAAGGPNLDRFCRVSLVFNAGMPGTNTPPVTGRR